MGTIPLKTINTREDIFNNIINTMASRVVTVSDISNYFTGYQNKKRILYDGNDTLIIQEYLFAYFADIPMDKDVSDWKQIVVRKSKTESAWEDSITGPRAYNYLMKLLSKHYSKTEIHNILSSYTDIKEETNQIHINIKTKGAIECYPNCYKYDINGAHQDALIEMFPRAKEDILDIYNKRHIKKVYKAYMNYSVGMFKKKGYEGAYWWIVHRTSKLLENAIKLTCPDDNLDCQIIYANTDGFIVSNPDKTLKHSTELGLFKEEAKGPVWVYTHIGSKEETSYQVYQYFVPDKENPGQVVLETKGDIRIDVRDKINLSEGKTVSYKLKKIEQVDFDGNIIRPEIITNLKDVHKEIIICE